MSERNTLVRSMHDLGAAAWFGGSLMGAVGLNGAAAEAKDPSERVLLAAEGWGRWAPVNALAIGAHTVGGLGLLLANRSRIMTQPGVRSNTVVKTIVTGAALATSAWGAFLDAKIVKAGEVPAQGATEPVEGTPPEVASALRQQKVIQWLTPVLTGAIIVLGAQQGEQQRPHGQLGQLVKALRSS